MIIDRIRELLSADPFEPFRVRASSGRANEVYDPTLVVVMKSKLFIAEPNSDRAATVPFSHISGVKTGANGRARRPRKRS